ncbi:MAG: hypothetical protein QM617_05300 [Comamonas sp.]
MTDRRPAPWPARSGAFAARRALHGALSAEAAYVLPVIIAAAMMFMELANIGLTMHMGARALERAIQQFHADSVATLRGSNDLEALLRQRMAAASHGYLAEDNIATIDIEDYASLDALSGGDTGVPAWHISVDIRKDFITPLPRLLGVGSGAFRYRYEQVLGYPPQPQENEE